MNHHGRINMHEKQCGHYEFSQCQHHVTKQKDSNQVQLNTVTIINKPDHHMAGMLLDNITDHFVSY